MKMHWRSIPTVLLILSVLVSCQSQPESAQLPAGAVDLEIWRGELDLGSEKLPFQFKASRSQENSSSFTSVTFLNGSEQIKVEDLSKDGDSLVLRFPIFESSLHFVDSGDRWDGVWHNDARKTYRRIPFHAEKGVMERFPDQNQPTETDLSGPWEVKFIHNGQDTTPAVGEFQQTGNLLRGTFLTETGDYRYLEGTVSGNELRLSCFDGAHAFLFKATILDNEILRGEFFSGRHWYETWWGVRSEDFTLADPDSLTFMKNPKEALDFAFINTDRELVSLSSPQFKGKPVIVQITGSWCPNCKDEYPVLKHFYEQYADQGLEMVAVSFEQTTDTTRALANMQRLKEYFGLEYHYLFGGRAGKRTASAAIPQLNHVMSYPTTIFLDRNHRVQRIYTGFAGPATGAKYDRLVESFEISIRELLATEAG